MKKLGKTILSIQFRIKHLRIHRPIPSTTTKGSDSSIDSSYGYVILDLLVIYLGHAKDRNGDFIMS